MHVDPLSGAQALKVYRTPCPMDPVSLAFSNLHPLLGILRSAYEQYQNVCHNREKCIHLLKWSQKVLVTVDEEIIKISHPDGMKDNIDHLCRQVNRKFLT